MEDRERMEARVDAAIEETDCAACRVKDGCDVLDRENQIALLGETIHRLEKELRIKKAECEDADRVILSLRNTITALEAAIIAQAETNAELREEVTRLSVYEQ